jgi:hypothetical protein
MAETAEQWPLAEAMDEFVRNLNRKCCEEMRTQMERVDLNALPEHWRAARVV